MKLSLKIALTVALLASLIFNAAEFKNFAVNNRCENQYSHLNKDAVCGSNDVVDKSAYETLRMKIILFINSEKTSGNVGDVSVYFRDLIHGPTFGIDERRDFAPASLLKLPISFIFFDIEDHQPGFLDTKIMYASTSAPTPKQTYSPRQSIREDHSYSIRDLISFMLVDSDNKSYRALGDYIQNDLPGGIAQLRQTFHDIGIIPLNSTLDQNISVHSYASLFRNLYNASYLSPAASEEILSLLSQSTFKSGLVVGVPPGIPIAHKFGETTFLDGVNQLHDCGIVYYPDNPYLLCIMTRGGNWDSLERIIQTISRMVYEEFNSRKL